MALLHRHTAFLHALRQAGLPVSLAEGLDAVRALTALGLADRDQVRAAYAATVVKRDGHRPVFDTLFDLWFPRSVGVDPVPADPAPADGAPASGVPAPGLAPGLRPDAEALRERLRDLLADGDNAGLRRLAEEAVTRFGRTGDSDPPRWSAHAAMNTLDPRTLMAALLRRVLATSQGLDGPLGERPARALLEARIETLREYVTAEVRRRTAEVRGVEEVARTATPPPLDQVDILRASRRDLLALRREITPLARRLAARLVIRRRHGRRGRLDFRRTVRASLTTGGVPLDTRHRPPRPHRPDLVVLCDASESVASFAHFTLMLTYALREQFTKVRAFAFIDTTDEVTRFFTPGGDLTLAMQRLTAEADLVRISGHSDYGRALAGFAERYPDAVGPRTALLVLGDARTNHADPRTEVLAQLAAKARSTHWLNPEPRREWDTGDSVATRYGRVVPMVECRNLAQLAAFVQNLA